jgi:predicted acetyltransferase
MRPGDDLGRGGGRLITVRACASAADLAEAWRVRALAFGGSGGSGGSGGPRGPEEGWTRGGWRGWVAELDGRVCGFARSWPYRQFFGGAAVPMAGLASVAVDPHARGRGVAGALLDALLPALRADGYAVSALYPSVSGLYRGRGWERVGVYEWVWLPLSTLRDSLPRGERGEPAVPLYPAGEADLPALHDCYLRLASTVDGMLDRRGAPFEPWRLLELDVVTVAGDPGRPRGYLAAAREEPGLVVYDMVAHDPDAMLALLRSLASWAGQLDAVRLRLLYPRELLPAELGAQLHCEPWMLRVVDLPAAVAARGWPHAALLRPGVAAELEVVDPHAPWHAGRHRLVVDAGTVHLEPGGAAASPPATPGRPTIHPMSTGTPTSAAGAEPRGAMKSPSCGAEPGGAEPGGAGVVRLTARGLAAWYAGAASTAELRRAGLLVGDPAAAAVLDALTGSAGQPRMANAF